MFTARRRHFLSTRPERVIAWWEAGVPTYKRGQDISRVHSRQSTGVRDQSRWAIARVTGTGVCDLVHDDFWPRVPTWALGTYGTIMGLFALGRQLCCVWYEQEVRTVVIVFRRPMAWDRPTQNSACYGRKTKVGNPCLFDGITPHRILKSTSKCPDWALHLNWFYRPDEWSSPYDYTRGYFARILGSGLTLWFRLHNTIASRPPRPRDARRPWFQALLGLLQTKRTIDRQQMSRFPIIEVCDRRLATKPHVGVQARNEAAVVWSSRLPVHVLSAHED